MRKPRTRALQRRKKCNGNTKPCRVSHPRTAIKISGIIYSQKKDLDIDEVMDGLLEYIESKGWYFAGGYNEQKI